MPKKQKSESESESESSEDEEKSFVQKKPVNLKKQKSESEGEGESSVQKMPKKKQVHLKKKKSESEGFESESSENESSEEEVITKKMSKVSVGKEDAKPKKRQLTTYNHYISMKLKELRLTYPGRESTKYMKMAAKEWSKLSIGEKNAFAKKIADSA